MWNRVISHSWFGKNNVFGPKYIDIYQFWQFAGVGVVTFTWFTLHFLFIIYKNGKSIRAWPILNSNSTLFRFLIFFPRMNNKNFRKRGPLFFYEVSIVVLIDFIAILLTPGIFLIQIVNTNNTNMNLIHFYSKNIIKMCFPKS